MSQRTFYRLVLHNPPSTEDFRSYLEMGKEPSEDAEWNRLASGYSVNSTLGYARKKAKSYPWKSQCYIAELRLPEDSPFVIEQTGSGGKHYTIWGDGELLQSIVLRVLPIREDADNV